MYSLEKFQMIEKQMNDNHMVLYFEMNGTAYFRMDTQYLVDNNTTFNLYNSARYRDRFDDLEISNSQSNIWMLLVEDEINEVNLAKALESLFKAGDHERS